MSYQRPANGQGGAFSNYNSPCEFDQDNAANMRKSGWTLRVSDDDWKQEWRDAVGGLLLQLAAAGEISAEDAQRDTCKALSEFVLIAIDLGGPGPFPPEEEMRREATLIELWPEACRRAGLSVVSGRRAAYLSRALFFATTEGVDG
jgi:hypothetical protein